jgi:hypothetical protein
LVTIRRVSVTAFQPESAGKATSPREAKRLALERTLERAIRGAQFDGTVAYRVRLDPDEKLSTVRIAFKRAKLAALADGVNLVTASGGLWIARTPQRRGRRPATT